MVLISYGIAAFSNIELAYALGLLPRALREEAIAAVQAAAGEGTSDYHEAADRADMCDKVLELIEQADEGVT
ncbi:MAG: hypothetical protein HY508_15645 [Acidobacteria bacterium]|nr:hypothetical protein [Acidobacteriota bacterium]